MKQLITMWLVALVGLVTANAQNLPLKRANTIPFAKSYASGKIEKSFIPPPADILLKSDSEKKSEIIVTYSLFPEEAITAFEYAVNIWEHTIESDVPIYIEANWRSQDEITLGSAGPWEYYTNFENIPHKDRYYAVAIAEKIMGREITGASTPDITATFNKDQDWYFGTDGETPSKLHDFVTVVLHEIGHGLGFTSFLYYKDGIGSYSISYGEGSASSFDLLIVDNSDIPLLDTSNYPLKSETLGQALTSNGLYADSPAARKNNNGIRPRLYAPSSYDGGSSISHLNEFTYRAGDINSLMTPGIGSGEAIHDPGPIAKGMLDDLGWMNIYMDFYPPKDAEIVQPIKFEVSITSDYQLDSSRIFVVYSTDAFESHSDTLHLVASDSVNLFTGVLEPQFIDQTYHYYVNAGDTMQRNFTVPSEAPNELYTVTIGTDQEKPVITHDPIPYFVLHGKDLVLEAGIFDNLGIDSAYVEYSIEGVAQSPFMLFAEKKDAYSGPFSFNLNELVDGNRVEYRIVAVDSSAAANKSYFPLDSMLSFTVEKIFDPITGYFNDFNGTTRDFVESDFEIYTVKKFESGALHSPHPYPSPNQTNTTFDFTALLKYPIILREGGTMSYDEIVLVEPGEPGSKFGGDEFWDYVIVEGSKDSGTTWLPFINGYDSRYLYQWEAAYKKDIVDMVSLAIGTPDMFNSNSFSLLDNGNFSVGDTVWVRFRLFSDPFAHGWGWAVDNLRIQRPVSVTADIPNEHEFYVYPNPFSDHLILSFSGRTDVLNTKIEIINLYGQKVYSEELGNVAGESGTRISTSSLNSGMYILMLTENNQVVYTQKIIKN